MKSFRVSLSSVGILSLSWGLAAPLLGGELPAPPSFHPPPGALALFDGRDLSLWKRFRSEADRNATTVFGGPGYHAPAWKITAGAMTAGTTGEDVMTRHEFGNYELHLDFFIPAERSGEGASASDGGGVFLSGRYEIVLAAASGHEADKSSAGAIRNFKAPDAQAALKPGRWQSLDVSYTHLNGRPATLSAWLNGVPVQNGVEVTNPTPGGFTQDLRSTTGPDAGKPGATGRGWFDADPPASARLDMGEGDFTIYSRFRVTSARGGTLVSKSPRSGDWKPNAKALFVRGGKLVYDIGWLGAITSKRRVSDGQWHRVILSKKGTAVSMLLDGELEASREEFTRPDVKEHAFKIGAASPNFGFDFQGDIAEVRFYDFPADSDQAAALSRGQEIPGKAPILRWKPGTESTDENRPVLEFSSLEGLKGPIRLRAGRAGTRFANIWIRPLERTDHRRMIASWNEASYTRGRRIYEGLCINCHGADGITPSLPLSRAFGKGDLKFGTDPYSMYLTLTRGNGNMAAQTWMTEEERYDVIHYIRERFMKPLNPAYRPVDGAYLASLPKTISGPLPETKSPTWRDFGPALASQLEKRVVSALTVHLPEKFTVSYDLHTMGLAGAWKGGFLDLSQTQHERLRGEGQPHPQGTILAGLQTWFWGHDGTLDYPKTNLLPRGPLPVKWLDYRGYYLFGDQLLFSYAIDGRSVLELPGKIAGADALVHTLEIGPGPVPLKLCVGQSDLFEDNQAGLVPMKSPTVTFQGRSGGVRGNLAVAGEDRDGQLGFFVAGAVLGDDSSLSWDVDARFRLVLNIPAGDHPRTIQVFRFSGRGEPALQSFDGLVGLQRLRGAPLPDLAAMEHGGPLRWPQVLTTTGVLGSESQAYTLDTLTLPESNPWNSWFRTAALDFFSDGRLAVSTHGGDVWIVSGVDADLKELKWKRFAAGLYEPFGVKVVDDAVYVTGKDRVTRLRDLNGDGEADSYESFSADTDVSIFFHAFNFDLQRDHQGNFYYSKAGEYTDHALPGAVIKISPDGRRREVYCTGFRVPNGMGILPDDRLTVSDNQGNWMPASKVSIVRPGGFYGYVPNLKTDDWAPDGGRIDVRKVIPPPTFDQPVIWMPQDFDNSSGGQVWAGDPRWGPLSGRLLHTSFGKGWIYCMMLQDVGDVSQAAIVKIPLDFVTGIDRARVNPKDGQVYAVGLNGWNGGGRPGLAEGGIQRVRYTGRPVHLLTDTKVRRDGIELTFNFQLEPASARNPASYNLEQWNYKWLQRYGSDQWSVKHPNQQGHDKVTIQSARLSPDGRKVFLSVADLRPVNQVLAKLSLRSVEGANFSEEVYLTINRVPDDRFAGWPGSAPE
jgi:mono/diheme cytochrome c family protein